MTPLIGNANPRPARIRLQRLGPKPTEPRFPPSSLRWTRNTEGAVLTAPFFCLRLRRLLGRRLMPAGPMLRPLKRQERGSQAQYQNQYPNQRPHHHPARRPPLRFRRRQHPFGFLTALRAGHGLAKCFGRKLQQRAAFGAGSSDVLRARHLHHKIRWPGQKIVTPVFTTCRLHWNRPGGYHARYCECAPLQLAL